MALGFEVAQVSTPSLLPAIEPCSTLPPSCPSSCRYDDKEGVYSIKNSWGASWGEQGYFRLSTQSSDERGACGVLQAPSYPVKKNGKNPDDVYDICGYFGWTMCGPHSSCVCQFSFFELFCFSWGCEKADSPAA